MISRNSCSKEPRNSSSPTSNCVKRPSIAKLSKGELVRIQRLTALGELSAGVSHNLNNILTGIIAPAEIIRDEIRDDVLKQHAETVLRAGNRAADLVRRLHRAVGSDRDSTESVDLKEAIEEAVKSTRPRWKDEERRSMCTYPSMTREMWKRLTQGCMRFHESDS
jgi:C4-dicarboxylate-specific signal transduction histidine kinase